MVVTPHMLVGAAGARRARSVAGALAIGALTHLALDAAPHRDYRMESLCGTVLLADTAVGVCLVWRLSRRSRVAMAGAIGGMLPDLARMTERRKHVNVTTWAHDTIHTPSRTSTWRSVSVQGSVAVTAAIVLGRRLDGIAP
jgi:hypothetical protein